MKNKKIFTGLASLAVISLILCGCGKKVELKDGAEVAVSAKDTKITANEYYKEIKSSNISTLVDMIDHSLFDKKYPTDDTEDKEVQQQINNIKSLLHESVLDNYNLYKYGLFISQIVGEIKGLDKIKVTKAYNCLQIKRKEDIDITASEICEILDRNPDAFLKEIFFDLERKILYNKLCNKKRILKSYVKSQYK